MANETQEIVLQIEVQGSIDNLAKLRSEMDTLIKTRQELTEKSKAGDIEATKEIEKVNSAVRNMQTEYKAQQRVLDGYNASKKSEVNTLNLTANSIQQNRDLLKQLTAQYITLKNPTEASTKKIKELSDVLKNQEAAIGNTTRNVGNYKQAFQEAASTLPGFGTAMKGVNAVMDANPVGLLVIAFTSLAQLLGKNAEVADQLSFAMAAITKVVSKLADDAVSVGKKLFDIFSNPQKAIKELIHLVEDNLVNRFKAFGVIASGLANGDLKAVGNGFTQLATGVVNLSEKIGNGAKSVTDYASGLIKVGKEGFEASKAMDDLVEKQAEFNGQAANYQKQADGLVKTLKDTTQEFSKRKKVAGEVADLEIKATGELVKGKQAELDAEKLSLKGIVQTAEQKAKIRSLELELIGLGIDKENALRFKQTRINILLGKEEIAAAKNVSESKLKIKESELKSLEPILEKERLLKAKADEDEYQALLEAQAHAAAITAKQVGSVNAQIDAEKASLLARLNNFKGNLLERENLIRESENRIKEIVKNSMPTPEQNYFESLGINQEALGKAEKTLQGFAQIVSSINDIVTKGFQIRENEIESQKNHEIDAVQSSTLAQKEKDAKIRQINKAAAQEKYQLELQAFNTSKGIQIVQAIISTALGVVNGLNAGLSLGPAGVVMGPVLAALAGVTGAVQIALIASQQPPPPPKFATGVIGLDGEGTETSDSIDARLSRGESVMTAKATKRFHRELAYMEMSVGNKPNYQYGMGNFATGFIPTPNIVSSDGGFVARDIARNSDNSALIQNAIKNGFALAPAPKLSIVEFESKQSSRNRSVNISEA